MGKQYKLKQGWGCLLPAALGTLTLRAEKEQRKPYWAFRGKSAMNNYTFQAPMKIIFGQDTLDQIAQEIEGSRIFIVMDRFLYESPLKTRMDTILAEQEIRYFTAFQSNPDFDSINQALREIQAFDATTVIGIGGGSTLDIAKFFECGDQRSEAGRSH